MEVCSTVELSVFPYTVHFIYTDDISKSRKERDCILGTENESYNCDGLHSYPKDFSSSWIFFTEMSSIGTISHECFHAVWNMFRYLGAKHNNEMMAYHLGYLVDNALLLKMPKELHIPD